MDIRKSTYKRLFLLVSLSVLLSSCTVTLFPGSEVLDKIEPESPAFWVCMSASPVIHELSHYIVLESKNIDHEFSGSSFTYRPESKAESSEVARAGFIGQLFGGLVLDGLPVNGECKAGYKLGSMLQIVSYPLRGGGDLEYLGYAGLSVGVNFMELRF